MSAYEFYTHGHSGHVEYEQNTNWIDRKGWGLGFQLKAGKSNWVHFSIPAVRKGVTVTKIILNYTLKNTAITALDLYDGPKRIFPKQFPLKIVTTPPGSEELIENDLDGKKYKIDKALGICLKVEAAENELGLAVFHAIGAEAEGW